MDASIGAALSPEHGTDGDALLQHADVAMYQAKQARTGFQAYDPSRDRHSRERLALIAELRRALERDELILHYQPKVDLSTGLIAGVEALVRWQHPVHGLRGPGAFLPHAEHTALMRPLTLHVLETALTQLARLARRRAGPHRRGQPRRPEPARPAHARADRRRAAIASACPRTC